MLRVWGLSQFSLYYQGLLGHRFLIYIEFLENLYRVSLVFSLAFLGELGEDLPRKGCFLFREYLHDTNLQSL